MARAVRQVKVRPARMASRALVVQSGQAVAAPVPAKVARRVRVRVVRKVVKVQPATARASASTPTAIRAMPPASRPTTPPRGSARMVRVRQVVARVAAIVVPVVPVVRAAATARVVAPVVVRVAVATVAAAHAVHKPQ